MKGKAMRGRCKPAPSKKLFEHHPLAAALKNAVSADVFFTLQKSLIHLLGTKWAYFMPNQVVPRISRPESVRTCFLLLKNGNNI